MNNIKVGDWVVLADVSRLPPEVKLVKGGLYKVTRNTGVLVRLKGEEFKFRRDRFVKAREWQFLGNLKQLQDE